MNYICLIDGVVEYGTNDLDKFNYYRLMYEQEHQDCDVEYLTLTDEEYGTLFPVEDDEIYE